MVSDKLQKARSKSGNVVLILVLMEYGLGPSCGKGWGQVDCVLILVLMEYGLGREKVLIEVNGKGLNPCFNGIWSRTTGKVSKTGKPEKS